VLDLSRTNQPGSTVAGTVVEQIVFGQDYDNKKNEIVSPAFVFPVAIPKVLFAFGIANGAQSLNFTQTLKLNGEVIPLPVTGFSVPPSGVGQKQLRVKGLAVKAGEQFPLGQYQIEIYSAGRLVQQGIFDVKALKSTGLRLNDGSAQFLVAWPNAERGPVNPDIFTVTEEESEVVPDDANYYDAQELQTAYTQLEHTDALFEPFPDEVTKTIEEGAALEAEASCATAGGVFDSASGQCLVHDPAEACQATGGIYDPMTNNCLFEPTPSLDLPMPTEETTAGPETPAPTEETTVGPETPVPTEETTTSPDTPVPTEAPTVSPDTPVPTEAPTTSPETPVPTEAPTASPDTPVPTEAPTAVPDTPMPLALRLAPLWMSQHVGR
jgi:hypothetical protein